MRPRQCARARAQLIQARLHGASDAAAAAVATPCRAQAGSVHAASFPAGTAAALPTCRHGPRLRFVRLAAVCGRGHDGALRRGRLGGCKPSRRLSRRLGSSLSGPATPWLRIADRGGAGRRIGGPVGGSRRAAARRGRRDVGAVRGLAVCGSGSAGSGVGGVDGSDGSRLCGIGGRRRVQRLCSRSACTAHLSVVPDASGSRIMRAQQSGLRSETLRGPQ